MSSVNVDELRQTARRYAQNTFEFGVAMRDIIESVGTGRVPVVQTSVLARADGNTYEAFNGVQFVDANAQIYIDAGLPAISQDFIVAKQKEAFAKVMALEAISRSELSAILAKLGMI